MKIVPFQIPWDPKRLADLNRRLSATRWNDAVVSDWSYGNMTLVTTAKSLDTFAPMGLLLVTAKPHLKLTPRSCPLRIGERQ
jgi:hypothetical protein